MTRPDPIPIALLRHGHTDWNKQGRIQGRTDRPLLPEAAQALKRLTLPGFWHKAQLYASPLLRAQQTAYCVAKKAPTLEPAFIEMHWGVWEGQRGADLLADSKNGYRHLESWGWQYQPPQGESLLQLYERVQPALAMLDRPTVIVTHINVMRVILAKAYQWNFIGKSPFQIKRNRLYPLTLENGRPTAPTAPIRLLEFPSAHQSDSSCVC